MVPIISITDTANWNITNPLRKTKGQFAHFA